MKKKTVIIEIGSNNTKTYFYEENKEQDCITTTIEFKKNYNNSKEVSQSDLKKLYNMALEPSGSLLQFSQDSRQEYSSIDRIKGANNLDKNILISDFLIKVLINLDKKVILFIKLSKEILFILYISFSINL